MEGTLGIYVKSALWEMLTTEGKRLPEWRWTMGSRCITSLTVSKTVRDIRRFMHIFVKKAGISCIEQRYLIRDTYGWEKHIEWQCCHTEEEVRRYFFSHGNPLNAGLYSGSYRSSWRKCDGSRTNNPGYYRSGNLSGIYYTNRRK